MTLHELIQSNAADLNGATLLIQRMGCRSGGTVIVVAFGDNGLTAVRADNPHELLTVKLDEEVEIVEDKFTGLEQDLLEVRELLKSLSTKVISGSYGSMTAELTELAKRMVSVEDFPLVAHPESAVKLLRISHAEQLAKLRVGNA